MGRVNIAIPFHTRGREPEILKQSFSIYSQMECMVHLCGSEGSHSREFARPFENDTTKYIEVPQGPLVTDSGGNKVLRDKFNDSLATFSHIRSGWVCLVGANDICNITYALEDLTPSGKVLTGVCSKSGQLVICQEGRMYEVDLSYKDRVNFMPGINAFSVEAMEDCDWRPYRYDNDEVGLERFAKDRGWTMIGIVGKITQLKDGNELNTLAHIMNHHKVKEI